MQKYLQNTILLFIFSCFYACSTSSDVPLPITTANEEALELYNTGWYHWGDHDAVKQSEYMKQALKIDPDFILANLYVVENDPNKRKSFRDKAIQNKNNGSEAEKLLVDMFIAGREGRTQDRIRLGKKLIEKYPTSSQAHVTLGDAHNVALEFSLAAENYKKAVKINPNNVNALWRLASQHINVYTNQILLPENKQDKKLGIKYVDKMISLRPEAAVGYQIRGNVDRANSNFESAKEWYDKALEKRRVTDRPASGLLGVIAHNLVFNGEFNLAQEYYDQGIAEGSTGNSKASVAIFKIQSYLFNDDYPGAIRVADRVSKDLGGWGLSKVQIVNGRANVELRKFLAYAHNQQKEEAYESLMLRKSYAQQAMGLMEVDEVRQRDFDSMNTRMEAWYHILFGEYNEAENKLAKLHSIVSNIQSPTALDDHSAMLGMVHLFRGDPKGAVGYFNENINTENYQYYSYFKALALQGSGQEESATEIFRQLANYNFNGLGISLVRSLAKQRLEKS
ncbi:uncharacterized protein METZ01_LOCUS142382 [marine metagenome]|uniref:Uncharacterized protein n=1 Tax=marine metagenome TaxID=408172 RepID=A0A381ZJL0_9ZZZZ|tara:strand:+ start:511 stop:2034 length:1524 start_codon:yes stop_codon:yes gene_type:complete